MFAQIVSNAAAGIVGIKAGDTIDQVTGNVPHLEQHGECVHADLHHIKDCLTAIANHYSREPKDDHFEILNIPVFPNNIPLHKNGYKHNSILVGNATTKFNLTITGVGTIPYTAGVGWTSLNLPDDTFISIDAAGVPTPVLYRLSDDDAYEGNSF